MNFGKALRVAFSKKDRAEWFSKYLFSWNNVPGNDSGKLINFLEKNGVEWVKDAKINKINDDKTIVLSDGKNSCSLSLNEEKTRAALRTDDGKTRLFIVKTENANLNIYMTRFEREQENLDYLIVRDEKATQRLLSFLLITVLFPLAIGFIMKVISNTFKKIDEPPPLDAFALFSEGAKGTIIFLIYEIVPILILTMSRTGSVLFYVGLLLAFIMAVFFLLALCHYVSKRTDGNFSEIKIAFDFHTISEQFKTNQKQYIKSVGYGLLSSIVNFIALFVWVGEGIGKAIRDTQSKKTVDKVIPNEDIQSPQQAHVAHAAGHQMMHIIQHFGRGGARVGGEEACCGGLIIILFIFFIIYIVMSVVLFVMVTTASLGSLFFSSVLAARLFSKTYMGLEI